jgi:hypothetical protein
MSAVLGGAAALAADPAVPVLAGAAVAVLLVFFAVLAERTAMVPSALVLLGAVFAIPEGGHGVWTPLYGAGLLLCAELAYWSLESRVDQRVHGDVVTPRLAAILLVTALSVAAGAVVLLAAEADVGRSPATTAAAALAIVASAGLLVLLTAGRQAGRRAAPRSD